MVLIPNNSHNYVWICEVLGLDEGFAPDVLYKSKLGD